MTWLWLGILVVLISLLIPIEAVSTVSLTSSVEEEGRGAACPGEEVTFTCTIEGATALDWISEAFSGAPQAFTRYVVGVSTVGDSQTYEGFTTTLTNMIPVASGLPSLTSTLTFTASTDELNGTVIQCSNFITAQSQVFTALPAMLTVSPPLNLMATVQMYGRDNFTVSVQWTYPVSSPQVDMYTITVGDTSTMVEGNETRVILTLSYNEVHTLSLTASLCTISSEEVTLNISEVSCGDPTPPSNGSLGLYESTEEGTKVNYQCDDGLIPGGEMMTTCLANGTWSPDSAELECVEPPQSDCGSPALSPNVSVEGYNDTVEGLVVIYSCNPGLIPEGESRSVCREDTDTWEPDPASLMCSEPGTTADCGYPDPPVNGSFGGDITSTVVGSEITYQCDDGLTPDGTMIAVCGEDGEWRPNPRDVECRQNDTPSTGSEIGGNDTAAVVVTVTVTAGVLLLVVLTIAAVVTGALCYCHSRRQKNKPTSKQPDAEYEEIPGEEQKHQGAIEMKENTAYGPVTPRGGPVYEVPGGDGGARRSNEGIQMGENAAYGQLHL